MAINNASLGALGVARDNHANASSQTDLAVSGSTDLAGSYEVTSVTVSGPTAVLQSDVASYTLALSGGSKCSDLKSSGRSNVTWTASAGDTVSSGTNNGCNVTWNNAGARWVKASWNDTFNSIREHTLNVTVI